MTTGHRVELQDACYSRREKEKKIALVNATLFFFLSFFFGKFSPSRNAGVVGGQLAAINDIDDIASLDQTLFNSPDKGDGLLRVKGVEATQSLLAHVQDTLYFRNLFNKVRKWKVFACLWKKGANRLLRSQASCDRYARIRRHQTHNI